MDRVLEKPQFEVGKWYKYMNYFIKYGYRNPDVI